MKQLELYLHDQPIGKVKVDSVRGHETWMFAFLSDYLNPAHPMLDPSIANVRGP